MENCPQKKRKKIYERRDIIFFAQEIWEPFSNVNLICTPIKLLSKTNYIPFEHIKREVNETLTAKTYYFYAFLVLMLMLYNLALTKLFKEIQGNAIITLTK